MEEFGFYFQAFETSEGRENQLCGKRLQELEECESSFESYQCWLEAFGCQSQRITSRI